MSAALSFGSFIGELPRAALFEDYMNANAPRWGLSSPACRFGAWPSGRLSDSTFYLAFLRARVV